MPTLTTSELCVAICIADHHRDKQCGEPAHFEFKGKPCCWVHAKAAENTKRDEPLRWLAPEK
jgi:hypothetical protein